MGMGGRGTSTFQVSTDETVASFLQRVVDKEGAVGVRIVCMGKQLVERRNGKDLTLADYGVYEGVNMSASLRLKGGAQEGPSVSRFNNAEVKKLGATVVTESCIFGGSDGCYESNVPKAKLSCGCVWCADCMKIYVKQQIETNLAISLSCGDTSHGDTTLDIALAYAIAALTPAQRNHYNAKMDEHQYKRPDSLMSVCPQGKCKCFIFRDDTSSDRVECGACHKFMCWKCKKEYKGKQDKMCGNDGCDPVAYITLFMAEATVKTIDNIKVTNTRICPNKQCNAVNVHDHACRHMTCNRCKHQYCHICLENWSGHNYSACTVHPIQTVTADMRFNQN